MADMRTYLFSVVAAAVISSIALKLVDKSSTQHTVIKLLTGVFLAITVIGPFTGLNLSKFSLYFDAVRNDAQVHTETGLITASEQTGLRISEGLETYILDKASSLGLDLDVRVDLGDDHRISSVSITGDAAPYLKSKLKRIVCNDLGILEDALVWS